MATKRELESLLDNYLEFNVGEMQRNFDLDKTIRLVKRPVQRYSYALMRASLNVFVHHHFADPLNSLAFDGEHFAEEVRNYVPQVWPFYLEEAKRSLPTAAMEPLEPLQFMDWEVGGGNRIGAWHRMDFLEFELDVLLQIANGRRRLGAFEGQCFLHLDQSRLESASASGERTNDQLGSLHLQIITDEILESLGISPESAISAIKWQMK